MGSSKGGGHMLLKNKKKIFGAWIIVHTMYGNLEPFGFLTSLTFKYQTFLDMQTDEWIA